jgi:glycosyltransferase involved in cell wall biosynthesis
VTGPLVTVVTPTWERNDVLLNRCIPSVLAQTYPDVEHVVVSDGPDPDLAERIKAEAPHVRFAQLGQWDHIYRWGTRARLHGIDLAGGDLIAYLDDDNAYRPEHLELLVAALGDADFAYSQMLVHHHQGTHVVGADPPAYGQIDTSLLLHRPALLNRETWRNSQPTIDWDLVNRWLSAGADWAFVQRITMDYYL